MLNLIQLITHTIEMVRNSLKVIQKANKTLEQKISKDLKVHNQSFSLETNSVNFSLLS